MASVSELTDGKYTELTYNAAGERIKGEFVQTIRELIRHCGLSAPGDNIYDMALANTVAEFQRKVGIPATGTFNDDTMLFIPAAGFFDGSTHVNTGFHCGLWSSSLNSDYPDVAWNLYFNSDNIHLNGNGYRYCGFSVRCVSTNK